MKRTVRDDSGAMLWLKNAAVRATPTARSSLAGLAFGLAEERQHASGAIDDGDRCGIAASAEASAALTMASTSAVDSGANDSGVAIADRAVGALSVRRGCCQDQDHEQDVSHGLALRNATVGRALDASAPPAVPA